MNYSEEEMKSLMIDHIEGKLDGELKEYIDKQIQKDEVIKKEYDQLKETMNLFDHVSELDHPIELRSEFLLEIEKVKQEAASEGTPKQKSKTIQIEVNWLYRAAAAVALIVVGVFIGRGFNNDSTQEIASLRKEMEETKALVIMNMENETSASSRIQGVLASNNINADADLLNALIKRMNDDENVNVRIAAVEALGNYANDEQVRGALLEALANQDKPLVQIRLIHLMVELDEKRAIKPLENITGDDNMLNTVQDEAQMGLFKLM